MNLLYEVEKKAKTGADTAVGMCRHGVGTFIPTPYLAITAHA